MSEKEVLEEMERIALMSDTEQAHGKADDLLCIFLRGLGKGEIVDAFEKVRKWYG